MLTIAVTQDANGNDMPVTPFPPNYTGITCDGTNYTVYMPGDTLPTPTPVPAEVLAAEAQLVAGVVLTSTGTPALNGTYGTDDQTQTDINAIITFIIVNQTFPGGGTVLPFPDASGDLHVFPSIASFQAFATAYANYLAEIQIFIKSNGADGSLPSSQITIP
jgi:hypothetical protein